MTTTNECYQPLKLTKKELVDVFTTDKEKFGQFSALREIAAMRYMEEKLSQEDQDIIWEEVAGKRVQPLPEPPRAK